LRIAQDGRLSPAYLISNNPAERDVLARLSSCQVQEHGARSAECSRCEDRVGDFHLLDRDKAERAGNAL